MVGKRLRFPRLMTGYARRRSVVCTIAHSGKESKHASWTHVPPGGTVRRTVKNRFPSLVTKCLGSRVYPKNLWVYSSYRFSPQEEVSTWISTSRGSKSPSSVAWNVPGNDSSISMPSRLGPNCNSPLTTNEPRT